MEHQLFAHAGGHRFLGQVIVGRTQPAGGDDDIGPGKGQLYRLGQARGIIPYHTAVVEVEPNSGQGRRDLGGIGIQGAAHQQLGAHTDDLRCFALHCFAFFSGDLRDIGQLQVHAAVFGNVILAALQIIAQQQIEHPGGLLHIGGGDPDEPAGFGVHGGQPHHFGLVFA